MAGIPWVVKLTLFSVAVNGLLALQYGATTDAFTIPEFGEVSGVLTFAFAAFTAVGDWVVFLMARAVLVVPGLAASGPIGAVLQALLSSLMGVGYGWPIATSIFRGSSSE